MHGDNIPWKRKDEIQYRSQDHCLPSEIEQIEAESWEYELYMKGRTKIILSYPFPPTLSNSSRISWSWTSTKLKIRIFIIKGRSTLNFNNQCNISALLHLFCKHYWKMVSGRKILYSYMNLWFLFARVVQVNNEYFCFANILKFMLIWALNVFNHSLHKNLVILIKPLVSIIMMLI